MGISPFRAICSFSSAFCSTAILVEPSGPSSPVLNPVIWPFDIVGFSPSAANSFGISRFCVPTCCAICVRMSCRICICACCAAVAAGEAFGIFGLLLISVHRWAGLRHRQAAFEPL